MGVSYRDERRAGTQERSDEKGIKLHMIRFIIVQCDVDVKSYIRSLVAASDIDEFEEKIEDKALVEGQEKVCRCIKNICKVIPSITRSEAIYNTNMIFPCFEAVLTMMKKHEHAPYFVPGEDELESMTAQLKKMGQKTDKRKIYKADGIIRLETAGAFGHEDYAKTAFDNSKGMFALLSMLKTIADQYKHASVEEFSKLKLYFVQPSGYHIRLWSMQYAKNGLYDFVREEKILLSEDFSTREEQLVSLVNFFLSLKSRLEEIASTIAALKGQHEENEKNYDSGNYSQIVSLSDIICPRIFKLSFNTHGQHFSKEHLMSSPETDF